VLVGIAEGRLVAIEGPHGAGKTTLVMAVTSYLKARGVNAIAVPEVTRSSPFVEEAVIFEGRPYSISSQLQLFGSQITQENLAARHHETVIADRSVFNPVAYGRFLLKSTEDQEMLDAMEELARVYARMYDGVFYLDANWLSSGTKDAYRPIDGEFRDRANLSLLSTLRRSGVKLFEIPSSLDLEAMTVWVVTRAGLGARAR
jgi:predicted ATPase